MRKRNSLQFKFFSFVTASVLIAFLFIGIFIGFRNKQLAIKKAHQYTQLVAKNQAANVVSFFENNGSLVQTLSLALSGTADTLTKELEASYDAILKKQSASLGDNIDAWVLWDSDFVESKDVNSKYLFKHFTKRGINEMANNQVADFDLAYSNILSKNNLSYSKPYKAGGAMYMQVGAPVLHGGKTQGFVGITINLSEINSMVDQTIEGGYITVLSNSATFVAHSNAGFIGKTFSENFPKEAKEFSVDERVSKGQSFDITTPFEGDDYYSFFVPIQFGDNNAAWSVEATAPMSVLIADTEHSILYSVIVTLLIFILLIVIIWNATRRITSPIVKVTENLKILSTGNTRDIKKMKLSTKDELQEMGESLNQVVDGLQHTENFALEIGKGNLNESYEVSSDSDNLGMALLGMRENLLLKEEELAKRKLEEDRTNWSTQGIAKFSEILRQDTNNMEKLGFNVMSNLIKYLEVNQGALFVQQDTEDAEKDFELVTAIAYDRSKFMKKHIKIGEGLVGRCAFEQKTIYITEIPDNYVNITSGLGTANPSCILIVPCVLNDEVYGVIELASFTKLEKHEIEFVEKLGETIASTISNVRINEKTAKLLNASQNQGEELAAQEEELRQNLEEMEATQEDLKRQMETNSAMRADLTKQNALLDALLTSLPDYIYFKDKDSKFLRISDSMLDIFEADSVDEVIGKSDFDYHTRENAQKYYNDEQEIMRTQQGFVDLVQSETLRDGSTVWNAVSKLPIVTKDGEAIGTFGISKNITEIKNLEMEAKKQSALLDALLNSLPDFIYFKDKESKFLRVSKSMLSIFNAKNVDEVIGKSDFDYNPLEIAQEYFDDEQRIMKLKKGFTDKLQKEKLIDGSTIWNSVSKLPIFDEDGEVIGTFGISKNITEIKNMELAAKKRNEDLAAQEEELRQNLEELETVSDKNQELKKQMDAQGKMIIDVLNELPIEIYLKDAKGKFILANDYLAANYNQKAEGIIGKSDFDFYTKKEAEAISKEEIKIIATGKAVIKEEKDKQNNLLLRKHIKTPFAIKHLNETGLLSVKIDMEALKKK